MWIPVARTHVRSVVISATQTPHLRKDDRVQLISSDQLKRLEIHLADVLGPTLASDPNSRSSSLPELSEALRMYVMAGGKRVRPQLVVWTFQHCVESRLAREIPRAVMDLACSWEIFHAFLLVHDDIIDKGETRRSQPSLHRRLASLDSGSETFGVNLAIVGGDLLFTAALTLLHQLDLPHDRYRQVLQLFSRVASITGFGQAIDIVQGHVPLSAVREEELLREYHWKTAAYTFEGPMLSGAIAAGAPGAAQAALSKFSLSLGQAYQLQNDLIDLSTPIHEGSDLVQGKRTITLLRARAALSDADRAAFDYRVAMATTQSHTAMHEAELLRQYLLNSDAATQTRQLVTDLLVEAETATRDPSLPQTLQVALSSLLGNLKASYFIEPATHPAAC